MFAPPVGQPGQRVAAHSPLQQGAAMVNLSRSCGILVFALSLMLVPGALHAAQGSGGILVKEIGGYHLGGKEVILSGLPSYETQYAPGGPKITINPNGGFDAFQMYVQYVKLANPKAKYPLLLWHGGGLSGVTYEDTPDGRKGWQTFFLKAGHDVYVSDAVERGRSGWARFPQINPGEPVFRPKSQAWESFRIGPKYNDDPAKREIYPGTRFPYKSFDQFTKQSVPRWTTSDAPTLEAYKEYVKSFPKGCVIIAHSQGAGFAWEVARSMPDKVKAVVMLEPGAITNYDKVDYAPFKGVRALFLFGELNTKYWQDRKALLQKVMDKFQKAGGQADWIELTDKGIKGNTHMLMMDTNSDQVAQVIQDWLKKQGLMKK